MSLLWDNIEQSDMHSTHDFAERLTLMVNLQAQQEYFKGGATILMEGVAINVFPAVSSKNEWSSIHISLMGRYKIVPLFIHTWID